MTTLCPGISLPSFSASSTMRFAILSLTEPPALGYSTLPTVWPHSVSRLPAHDARVLTQIALNAFHGGDLVQPDERRVADRLECVVEDLRCERHACGATRWCFR